MAYSSREHTPECSGDHFSRKKLLGLPYNPHWPSQQRLVHSSGEEDIQQEALGNHQWDDAASEAEPVEVILDEGGGGADLYSVGVIGRILKQAIVGVEDLSGDQEEELTRGATVV